jgi:hypothetical protein
LNHQGVFVATAEKLLQLLLHTHKVLRKGDDDFFSAFALVKNKKRQSFAPFFKKKSKTLPL